jgi:hypothetical protein
MLHCKLVVYVNLCKTANLQVMVYAYVIHIVDISLRKIIIKCPNLVYLYKPDFGQLLDSNNLIILQLILQLL